MVRWHHRFNGHKFEQAPGDSEGERSMVCYSPWSQRARHGLAAEHQENICVNYGIILFTQIQYYSFRYNIILMSNSNS